MRNGDKFPSLVVFHDGTTYWLVEGFHRFEAAQCAEKADFECTIHKGTMRDAILYSCGTNAVHGLRRSNEDKRRVVTKLLEDSEWSNWSDREIARRCSVSNEFVGRVREWLTPPVTVNVDSETRTYRTKHGTTATMNTANIGKSPPQTSPREP
jgi:hypothetical protein